MRTVRFHVRTGPSACDPAAGDACRRCTEAYDQRERVYDETDGPEEPTCRCEPGDPHPECLAHQDAPCCCTMHDNPSPECLQHGLDPHYRGEVMSGVAYDAWTSPLLLPAAGQEVTPQ